jgi:hypothetical protein
MRASIPEPQLVFSLVFHKSIHVQGLENRKLGGFECHYRRHQLEMLVYTYSTLQPSMWTKYREVHDTAVSQLDWDTFYQDLQIVSEHFVAAFSGYHRRSLSISGPSPPKSWPRNPEYSLPDNLPKCLAYLTGRKMIQERSLGQTGLHKTRIVLFCPVHSWLHCCVECS